MDDQVDLDAANARVAKAEAAVNAYRDLLSEIDRQGRFHLRGQPEIMLADAQRVLAAEEAHLDQLLEADR